MRPFVAGKLLKPLKPNRKLMKAFDLANQIARREITFREACKVWAGNSKVMLSSPRKQKLPSQTDMMEESVEVPKPVVAKKPSAQKREMSGHSKSRTGRNRTEGSNAKTQSPPSRFESSAEKRDSKKKLRALSRATSTKSKPQKAKPMPIDNELAGGKKEPIETKTKKAVSNGVSKKTPSLQKSKHTAKASIAQDKKSAEASSYSSESEQLNTPLKVFKARPTQIKQKSSEKLTATLEKTKRIIKELSVASIRESDTQKAKQHARTNLFIEPLNYPALSVLEETPREMTPIKSPKVDLSKSGSKSKLIKPGWAKLHLEKSNSKQNTAAKEKKKVAKESAKKSIRKSSGTGKERKSVQKDCDNSSYDTQVVDQIYNKLPNDVVKEGIKLKDIIPLRGNSRTHSTITASSTPVEPCPEFEKKEFLLDDSQQAHHEESELLEDSMLLLSAEQRNHILRSDAELERCMKEFQEVERIYNLHKGIPRTQVDLNALFSRLIEVCKKAEIHKLPSEVLLSNNIGASIHTINLIVKKIGSFIPEEHKSVTLILDKSMSILVRRLEEYVRVFDLVLQRR